MRPFATILCVPILLAMLGVSPAPAQPAPTRVRGTVEAVSPGEMKVRAREGGEVEIRLPENVRVVAVARAELSQIVPGAYVGIAAMPRPDGTQLALEVVVFPPAMRGVGEGHRPWDLMPESTMTNATVEGTVANPTGSSLTLRYKDGEKTIVVPPGIPIVTLVPATTGDVKPGTRVVATVAGAAPSGLSASSLVVGRDGVDPPM